MYHADKIAIGQIISISINKKGGGDDQKHQMDFGR